MTPPPSTTACQSASGSPFFGSEASRSSVEHFPLVHPSGGDRDPPDPRNAAILFPRIVRGQLGGHGANDRRGVGNSPLDQLFAQIAREFVVEDGVGDVRG